MHDSVNCAMIDLPYYGILIFSKHAGGIHGRSFKGVLRETKPFLSKKFLSRYIFVQNTIFSFGTDEQTLLLMATIK